MDQLFTSSDTKKHHFFTLFYDNLMSFISFLYSHPIQLAYVLYFSPYILQLFSFLFPLLLTTSIILLLLSLHFMLKVEVEVETATVCLLDQLHSLIVTSVGNVFEWEFEIMDELYKNSGQNFEVGECLVEIFVENLEKNELLESNAEIEGATGSSTGRGFNSLKSMEELQLECSEKSELFDSHGDRSEHESSEVYEIPSLNSNATEEQVELSSEKSEGSELFESHCSEQDSFVPQTPDRISEMLNRESVKRTGEHYRHSSLSCESTEDSAKEVAESYEKNELLKSQMKRVGSSKSERMTSSRMMHHTLISSPSVRRTEKECRPFEGLQRDGSMRKEKEWKRTLACKLYEERMTLKLCEERTVVEGAEEMDLLWEAYESDADKANKSANKVKSRKKEAFIEEEDEEDEEEEGDEAVGQLCCLQALRLSTGKLNFGVRRPNLMKMSKAFKGIGFFQRSSSQRKTV